MTLIADKTLCLQVDAKELCATLSVESGAAFRELSAADILAELKSLNLQINTETEQTVTEFCRAFADHVIPETIVVARGTAPIADTPGFIEKLYEQSEEAEKKFSHYNRSSIIIVKEGQPLVKIRPPVVGQDGCTVFGKPVPRVPGEECHLQAGDNVRQAADTLYATCAGQLNITDDAIWVNEVLEIDGDVDFSIGNIHFGGNVIVGKNVLDLFEIVSGATVTVQGIVEAAHIEAGQDVLAVGGITGKEKARLQTGRHVEAKYITNATIRAGGDIYVHKEMVNCDAVCQGKLQLENGALIGGEICVAGGAIVRELGSDGYLRTVVVAGVDQSLYEAFTRDHDQISELLTQSKKIRQVVEPMLRFNRRLSAEKRRQAATLLKQAQQDEEKAHELLQTLRNLYEASLKAVHPEVIVQAIAYPEVVVRFPRVQTVLRSEISGPLKLYPVLKEGRWHIAASGIDSAGHQNSAIDLGGERPKDDFYLALDRLLEKSDAAS